MWVALLVYFRRIENFFKRSSSICGGIIFFTVSATALIIRSLTKSLRIRIDTSRTAGGEVISRTFLSCVSVKNCR